MRRAYDARRSSSLVAFARQVEKELHAGAGLLRFAVECERSTRGDCAFLMTSCGFSQA